MNGGVALAMVGGFVKSQLRIAAPGGRSQPLSTASGSGEILGLIGQDPQHAASPTEGAMVSSRAGRRQIELSDSQHPQTSAFH